MRWPLSYKCVSVQRRLCRIITNTERDGLPSIWAGSMFDWGKMRSIWGRIHSGRCLSIQVSFEELFLFLSCCRCGLLCCNELWVVYEAVLVLIVAVMKLPNKTGFPVKYWIRICSPVQYWVNHVLQLLISKNLCLRSRTSRLGVMIGLCARMRTNWDWLKNQTRNYLIVPMYQRFHQL